MRTLATRARAINQYNGLGNQLWDLAGNRPSLDLRFADEKSLVDATTGTNLVDHTRASSGTYVGSDGLIKTATTNLLLRSEEFDQSPWAPTNGTVTTNQVTAPNGSTTADLIEATATAAYAGRVTQAVTGVTASNYSISVYAKAGNSNFVAIGFADTGSGSARGYFDLSTDTSSSISTVWNVNNTDIQNVGNGWYRCTMAFSVGSTDGSADLQLYPVDGLSSNDVTSGNSVYIWGAQLEQSSTVGEYVKTTSTINSAPRFDHDPTTGESLGLLVEESRTNLVLQSQSLATSPWNDSGATTSLASTITDVFGGTSASFKLTEDNTNASHYVQQSAITLAASTSYSVTVWFKQGSANRDGRIFLNNASAWDGSSPPRARIDFSTGTVQTVLGFTSTSLASYSNGWYKFTGTALTSASGGSTALRLMVSDGTENYQGDGTSYVYVGPCQLEVGAFPTSYIPTVGAGVITPGYTTPAVTRAADVADISGSNFSSWYRQDEGTVFADCNVLGDNGSNQFIYSISDGVLGDEIRLFKPSATNSISSAIEDSVAGITSNIFGNSDTPFGSPFKVAHAFATNYAVRAVNGINSSVDNTVTLPAVNQVRIGARMNETFYANIHLSRLAYWPTRLPNETLQAITN